jgi:hypothetical protein
MFLRRISKVLVSSSRRLSTEIAPAKKPEGAVAAASPSSASSDSVRKAADGGSTFFQRFSSFLAGCGVGFGVTIYFVYNELIESNEKLSADYKRLEAKLTK